MLRKLRRGVQYFRILPKTEHKFYVVILCEILFWVFIRRTKIGYYMDYKIYLKGKRMEAYVVPSEFLRLEKSLNTPEYYPILEDKYFFYKILEGKGFNSPRNLYLIDPSGIFQLETSTYISGDELLQKDLDGFCKVINGFGGNMIYRTEVMDGKLLVNKEQISVADFLQLLGRRKFLIQERIKQHTDLDLLNPSCLNTMRMLTIRNGQSIHLFQDYLRIGINDNYVDNSLSGNIMIGIHEDGKLMEFAYSSGKDVPSYTMDSHPNSGINFKDVTLPFYSESVEMVKSMHQLFQQFFMIGWDIGISPEGPVVIEGNNITTLYPFQVIYGGMKSSFNDLAASYQTYI